MLKTIWQLAVVTFKAWWRDDVFRLAATIAFYTIFSLAPVLLISVGISSLVFSEQAAKAQVVQEIESLSGAEGARVARQVLNNMIDITSSLSAIVYGIIVMIIGSTAVFVNLQAALNEIWHVRPKSDRSAWKDLLQARARSFGIVLAVGFILLVSMVVSALLNGLQAFMADRWDGLPWLWRYLNLLVSLGVITLMFAMIYKYLPDVIIAWKDVLIGAAITSILFSAGKYMIGFYLGRIALGSAYGAAGSFVILLIWIYYSALIFFLGAEFTQAYAGMFGSRIRPKRHAESAPDRSQP